MEKENIERVLIIVDMVNGFINEGPMADKHISHIIPNIDNLAKEYDKNEILVIKDCHTKDSVEFKAFPPHCLKGTSQANTVEELQKYENEGNVFEKNSTSAMFADGFVDKINELKNLKKVTITGCCTDICILNLAIPLKNYFNQNNRDIEIIVPKDMVETYNSNIHNREEYQDMAFKLLSMSGITLR